MAPSEPLLDFTITLKGQIRSTDVVAAGRRIKECLSLNAELWDSLDKEDGLSIQVKPDPFSRFRG